MTLKKNDHTSLVFEVKQIFNEARQYAYSAVNTAMVKAYWLVGRRIVEEEQHGKERADYGGYLIKKLSQELTKEFGKGFSERSIREYRQFYLTFTGFSIRRTVSAESDLETSPTAWSQLSWSHYRIIMRVVNPDARALYIKETAEQSLSIRTLEREKTLIKLQMEQGEEL